MPILIILFVAIISSLVLMTVAAIVSDPSIVAQFGSIIWRLLGPTDHSPFFWIFTVPLIVMVVALVIWVLLMHILYAVKPAGTKR